MASDSELEERLMVCDTATAVAKEIYAKFHAHTGKKWETHGANERAVRISLQIDTLAGKSVKELSPHGTARVGDFDSYVYSALVRGGRNRILHGLIFELQKSVPVPSDDQVYTGVVVVHEVSNDYD